MKKRSILKWIVGVIVIIILLIFLIIIISGYYLLYMNFKKYPDHTTFINKIWNLNLPKPQSEKYIADTRGGFNGDGNSLTVFYYDKNGVKELENSLDWFNSTYPSDLRVRTVYDGFKDSTELNNKEKMIVNDNYPDFNHILYHCPEDQRRK